LNLPNALNLLMPLRWMPVHYNRRLLKDPIACLMAKYITQRVNARTLSLFRHPAGFVRSILDLGWPSAKFVAQFLDTSDLMKYCLVAQEKVIRVYAKSDGLESAVVLNGCICRVLWPATERNPAIMPLRFEDLAANPLPRFEELFKKLGLVYDDTVLRMHVELIQVGDVPECNDPHAVRRNSARMAWKWGGSFSPSELDLIAGLWNEFGVPLYYNPGEWGE